MFPTVRTLKYVCCTAGVQSLSMHICRFRVFVLRVLGLGFKWFRLQAMEFHVQCCFRFLSLGGSFGPEHLRHMAQVVEGSTRTRAVQRME